MEAGAQAARLSQPAVEAQTLEVELLHLVGKEMQAELVLVLVLG